MGNLSFDELSSQYFDVLKEIGNIGAGNATTALAQMMGGKIDMSVPQVKLLDFKDVGDMMGGAEQIMAGIYLKVEGDIDGSIMFLLEQHSARHLVSKMMILVLSVISSSSIPILRLRLITGTISPRMLITPLRYSAT